MKPTLSQSIQKARVHWFKRTNKYLIVDTRTDQLFDLFLRFGNTSSELKSQLSDLEDFKLDESEIDALIFQLKQMVDELSSPSENPSREVSSVLEKEHAYYSSELYAYRRSYFIINYGSEKIKNVFHPSWAHLKQEMSQTNKLTATKFTIDKSNNDLRLFQNGKLTCSHPSNQFHYLQGKLALELINLFYKKNEEDWLASFHASAISNGSSALLLVGESGSGKSTLTAILTAKGFDLVADDMSPMLASNQEIYKFPNGISIKQGAFEAIEKIIPDFSSLPATKSLSKNVNSKFVYPENKLTDRNSYPCNTVLLVKYDSSGPNELTSVQPEIVLSELIPDSWINPQTKSAKIFLSWLKDLRYLRLSYSTNEFAINAVTELFTNDTGSS